MLTALLRLHLYAKLYLSNPCLRTACCNIVVFSIVVYHCMQQACKNRRQSLHGQPANKHMLNVVQPESNG
jgi:hypothetical protein